jgi:hypothetical protein
MPWRRLCARAVRELCAVRNRAERPVRHVHVALRRRSLRVPQQSSDEAQRSAARDQVGRERVSQIITRTFVRQRGSGFPRFPMM